mgnify:CR=1 FL=1
MKTSSILSACADKLEKPGAWIQGKEANLAQCSVTAIDGLTGDFDLTKEACRAICASLGVPVNVSEVLDVIRWNDAPERTQAEVVAAFRKAAQAEREAGR